MFFKPIYVHSVANNEDVSISSITMWNTVCQLRKHDFSCCSGPLVNNLKERKIFSNQMNRNRLDLILAWCDTGILPPCRI